MKVKVQCTFEGEIPKGRSYWGDEHVEVTLESIKGDLVLMVHRKKCWGSYELETKLVKVDVLGIEK